MINYMVFSADGKASGLRYRLWLLLDKFRALYCRVFLCLSKLSSPLLKLNMSLQFSVKDKPGYAEYTLPFQMGRGATVDQVATAKKNSHSHNKIKHRNTPDNEIDKPLAQRIHEIVQRISVEQLRQQSRSIASILLADTTIHQLVTCKPEHLQRSVEPCQLQILVVPTKLSTPAHLPNVFGIRESTSTLCHVYLWSAVAT